MSDSDDSDDEFLALATGAGKKRAAASSKKKKPAKKAKKSSKSKKSKKSKRRGSDSDESTEEDLSESASSSDDSLSNSDDSPPPTRTKRVTRATRRPDSDEDAGRGAGGGDDDEEEDAELERMRKEVEAYGQDFYIDDKDRRELQKMTELDRQTILAEREEKFQAYQERLELRRRLQEQKGGTARRSGRGADASKSVKSRGLSELKDKRNARKSGQSYVESDSEDDKKTKKRPVCNITLDQLRRIVLKRADLGKWDMFPYFEDVVPGCYVRFMLPPAKPGDKPVYRLCRIHDVTVHKRTYKLDNQTGQMSNTALTLAYGKAQKSFAMDNISNSPVLPEEFERWKKTMEAEFQQFPDADYIEMKAKELDAQRARPNTKEETAVMLSKKKELRSLPTNLAEARAQAVSERERALALGDAAKVEQLDAEIARLDEASRSRVIMSSSMEAFSEINKRNRDRDLKRDALLAEEGRAKQGLSPAITSPGRGLSPAPSVSNRGLSPGLSPRPTPTAGPLVGIGISLDDSQSNGNSTPRTDIPPPDEKRPPLPAIMIETGKLSLEKTLATYKFDDDDLPPPPVDGDADLF